MKAAVLHQAPGDLAIEDVDLDSPGPEEVLIRVVASGLCHSDLHVMEGKIPWPLPSMLGHEAAAVVEAVGSHISEFKPGDHVVSCLSQFCGACLECSASRTWLCQNRRGLGQADRARPRATMKGKPVNPFAGLGAFAERMVVHRNAIVTVPKELPLDRAALLGCAVVTGVGSVINGARVTPGSTVAVIGCGGIGLNLIQGAVLAGAGRIIAIDLQKKKLELARIFGATDVIDASSADDPVKAVQELTKGGVDYAFEAIGLTKTAEQAFAMIRPGRTAYLVGVPPMGASIQLPGIAMLMLGKGLQGLFMGSSRFKQDIPMLATLYLRGKLKLDELIAERITLAQVNEGYAKMRTGEQARSVILFQT
jgi:S-(hydroxymethyl)glutathione dehydrogenase/alcohol dehydrogenase